MPRSIGLPPPLWEATISARSPETASEGPTPIVIELNAEQLALGPYPATTPDWMQQDHEGVRIAGGRWGFRQAFVSVTPHRLLVAASLDDVIAHLGATDSPRVSPFGLSHTLETGFVPMPSTIYEGVYRLGSGDWIRATADGDRIAVDFGSDYPWLPTRSRQDQRPDTATLYDLIVRSLNKQLELSGGEAFLMLSSGKDSVALAVALADSGYDVPCITYKSGGDDLEHAFAADFCRTLGLRHQIVEMPRDPGVIRRYLTHYFENAVAPSADHALIPFVVAVAESGLGAGGVIDGGGNDTYMGYLPSRIRVLKRRYRVRGRRTADLVGRLTRVDSPINYLARSEAASSFPGRNLRHHETRRLYADAVETAGYWYDLGESLAAMNRMDATVLTLLRHTEGARSNDKVRIVAPAHGLTALLPYCDKGLAEYYFHLPQDARYDIETGTNKVLLRQLLDEKIGYAASGVGSGHFSFDGAGFVAGNAEFVREEILSCMLWEPAIRDMVAGWLEALPRRPFLFHVLVPLFLVSGWHNHSRYLAG